MIKEQVKQILSENNISVKKQFGQNFLLDNNILEKIVKSANIEEKIGIVEIGPGLGFLTSYLAKAANKVLCYEIDEDMVNHLHKQEFKNVEIIHEDFLKRNIDVDFETYFPDQDIYIIANLPYYITTPILLKVLEESKKVKKMIVMMQTEVAKRICGKPSTKDYNSLSVLIQYFTNPKILFSVKPNAFYPEPNVDSSVIEIVYKEKIEDETKHLDYFLKFNRNIFTQRRKTLLNNLIKTYNYDKEQIIKIFEKNHLDAKIRSEALTLKQIVQLSDAFYDFFEKR